MRKRRLHLVFIFLTCVIQGVVYAQHTHYTWNDSLFSADATQAKRITIGRIYFNVSHWGEYGSMKVKLTSEYFKSSVVEYLIMANPATPGNAPSVSCLSAKGYTSHFVRIALGPVTSAGSSYSGGNNNYQDIYLDVDYYTRWYVEVDVSGAFFSLNKASISANEYSYMTLFTSPSSDNIAAFNTEIKEVALSMDNAYLSIPGKVRILDSSEIRVPASNNIALKLIRGNQSYDTAMITSLGHPYLQIGGVEYRPNSIQSIGFGYTSNGSYQPAELGFKTRTIDGYTYGDIVFATRDNTGNVPSVEKVRITYDGKMGIGVDNPTEKLTVNGNIKARKVVVSQLGWSDYVFDDDYKLMPITELDTYIKNNKHLPDIPSKDEIFKKGLDIGEGHALLLKKIEELTLYVIELGKDNKKLKERLYKQDLELRKQNQILERITKLKKLYIKNK